MGNETIPSHTLRRWRTLMKGSDMSTIELAKPDHRWGLLRRQSRAKTCAGDRVMTCLACLGEFTVAEGKAHMCALEDEFRLTTERFVPDDPAPLIAARRAKMRAAHHERKRRRQAPPPPPTPLIEVFAPEPEPEPESKPKPEPEPRPRASVQVRPLTLPAETLGKMAVVELIVDLHGQLKATVAATQLRSVEVEALKQAVERLQGQHAALEQENTILKGENTKLKREATINGTRADLAVRQKLAREASEIFGNWRQR